MGNKGHTYPRICAVCGEPFEAVSPTGRYCPKEECQRQKKEDYKQKKREIRLKHLEAGEDIDLRGRFKIIHEAEVAHKKSHDSIMEVMKKATEKGMSYGEYVGKYGS